MTTKKQRAAKAARAAKRIPVIGTTVVLLPAVEAAADTINMSNLTQGQTWKNFFTSLKWHYTGVGDTGIDGQRILKTWIPIGLYLVSRKLAGKQISKIFGALGLRY